MRILGNPQTALVPLPTERRFFREDLALASATTQVPPSQKHLMLVGAMEERAKKVEDIVAARDIRHISYTDLAKMTEELIEAGAIKISEKLDFLPPSMEFSNLDGSRNADWNAPKDYLDLRQQALQAHQSGFSTDASSLRSLEYQVALLQRFVRF
jgi:hypothetical protein